MGYLTENQVLAELGLNFKKNKAESLALLPKPKRVVDTYRLFSPDQVSALRLSFLPECYFNLQASRFITGEFLPKNYRFRRSARALQDKRKAA